MRISHAIRAIFPVLLVLAAILASGCTIGGGKGAEGQRGDFGGKQPRGTKPYTIMGKTYYPLLSAHGFREEGMASWYGADFHGKKTANGERYDMYGMTAAHKLLPFNTQVKVTNKTNGKSIVVRINDRGPFVAERVIDLTKTGASQLGMVGPGTAPVIVETIGTVPGLKPRATTTASTGGAAGGSATSGSTGASGADTTLYDLAGNFYVQLGAFSSKTNADGLVSRLQAQGIPARAYHAAHVGFWRVQAGPFPSLTRAEQVSNQLQSEFPKNFVVAE